MQSTPQPGTAPSQRERRERRARILGVAAALGFMLAASLAIHWPAPGISVALGFAVYLIARGSGA